MKTISGKPRIIFFSMMILSLLVPLNTAFADESVPLLYGKGTTDESSPFPGETIHILANKDTATIVHPTTHGIEMVSLSMQQSEACIQKEATFCFDGTVTAIKNTQVHKTDDKIAITFDLHGKQVILSFESGMMQDASVTVNLSKIIMRFDGPFTLVLSQEGGFAGIQKTISIDTSSSQLTENGVTASLADESIRDITKTIKKIKFQDVSEISFPPVEGSADYFTYTIQIVQGRFHKLISWTDTSDNVPAEFVNLKDIITKAALNAKENKGPEAVVMIAKDFVMTSPTFAFDGIKDSIQVEDVMIRESFPEQYVVTISFDSLHGWYGDRTNQMVTQAITPHVITVTVVSGQIVSAIIDDVWDELNQASIK
jgi:hypothetical protein